MATGPSLIEGVSALTAVWSDTRALKLYKPTFAIFADTTAPTELVNELSKQIPHHIDAKFACTTGTRLVTEFEYKASKFNSVAMLQLMAKYVIASPHVNNIILVLSSADTINYRPEIFDALKDTIAALQSRPLMFHAVGYEDADTWLLEKLTRATTQSTYTFNGQEPTTLTPDKILAAAILPPVKVTMGNYHLPTTNFTSVLAGDIPPPPYTLTYTTSLGQTSNTLLTTTLHPSAATLITVYNQLYALLPFISNSLNDTSHVKSRLAEAKINLKKAAMHLTPTPGYIDMIDEINELLDSIMRVEDMMTAATTRTISPADYGMLLHTFPTRKPHVNPAVIAVVPCVVCLDLDTPNPTFEESDLHTEAIAAFTSGLRGEQNTRYCYPIENSADYNPSAVTMIGRAIYERWLLGCDVNHTILEAIRRHHTADETIVDKTIKSTIVMADLFYDAACQLPRIDCKSLFDLDLTLLPYDLNIKRFDPNHKTTSQLLNDMTTANLMQHYIGGEITLPPLHKAICRLKFNSDTPPMIHHAACQINSSKNYFADTEAACRELIISRLTATPSPDATRWTLFATTQNIAVAAGILYGATAGTDLSHIMTGLERPTPLLDEKLEMIFTNSYNNTPLFTDKNKPEHPSQTRAKRIKRHNPTTKSIWLQKLKSTK